MIAVPARRVTFTYCVTCDLQMEQDLERSTLDLLFPQKVRAVGLYFEKGAACGAVALGIKQ